MAAKKGGTVNKDVYKQLFKEADKNGDGHLDVCELRDLLKRGGSNLSDRQVADTFVFFDGPKGDRRISYDEFVKGLELIQSMLEKVKEIFKEIDKDNSGFLERDELKQLLQQVPGPKGCKTNFCDEEVDKILRDADKDGNNKISLDEFLHAVL